MPVRASTTPKTPPMALSNIAIAANGGYEPMGITTDRTKFIARYKAVNSQWNGLAVSSDGGVTWVNVKNFGGYGDITAVMNLPDGELVVALCDYGSFAANLQKSTGFAANPSTASWAFKKSLIGGSLLSRYSLNDWCWGTNGVMLASEGGAQTGAPSGLTYTARGTGYTTITLTPTASGGTGHDIRCSLVGGAIERIAVINGGTGHTNGTFSFTIAGDGSGASISYTVAGGVIQGVQTGAARRLWMSTDSGNTWNTIFDLYLTPTYKYGIGLHLHGVAYDEEWDRIWVLFGDNTGDGYKISGFPTGTQLAYSDDRGATWSIFAGASQIEGQGIGAQYTAIAITKTAVLLGADAQSTFGIVVVPRTGYRQCSDAIIASGTNIAGIVLFEQFTQAYSANRDLPVFASHQNSGTTGEVPVNMSTDGGKSWYEIWRETDLVARPLVGGGGVTRIFGPDTSNRVLGHYNGYGHLRATLA